jgi:hypothetical protein
MYVKTVYVLLAIYTNGQTAQLRKYSQETRMF